MPEVLIDEEYFADQDFETTVSTGGQEYAERGSQFDRKQVLKRSFIAVSEGPLQVERMAVSLTPGQAIRDPGLLTEALKQCPQALSVQERVKFFAGDAIPAEIGEVLLETRKYPVKKREVDLLGLKLPETPAPSGDDAAKADAKAPEAPAEAPAAPAPKKAAAKADAKAEAGKDK